MQKKDKVGIVEFPFFSRSNCKPGNMELETFFCYNGPGEL